MTATTQVPSPDAAVRPDVVAIGHRRRRFPRWFRETGWRHIIGVIMSIFAAFPLLYVFSASLNPGGTLVTANSLFSNFSFQSYADLFDRPQQPYAAWFGNTLLIGGISSLGTVFLGALAAYAFSRMRFIGRRVGLLTLLLVQMFPQLLSVAAHTCAIWTLPGVEYPAR